MVCVWPFGSPSRNIRPQYLIDTHVQVPSRRGSTNALGEADKLARVLKPRDVQDKVVRTARRYAVVRVGKDLPGTYLKRPACQLPPAQHHHLALDGVVFGVVGYGYLNPLLRACK